MDRREAAIERIRKLLKMTRANGCTEAEAMAAAEKAAALMAELRVDFGDLEFEAAQAKLRTGFNSIRSVLWINIARCTNTAEIFTDAGIEYVGRAPWPEVARYLHQLTDRALNAELKQFQAGKWYRRRSSLRAKRAATHDFTQAMVHRLVLKLRELFAATRSDMTREAAGQELARRHPGLQTVQRKTVRPKLGYYNQAAAEGVRAGEGVEINHGVAGAAKPLQIGGAA